MNSNHEIILLESNSKNKINVKDEEDESEDKLEKKDRGNVKIDEIKKVSLPPQSHPSLPQSTSRYQSFQTQLGIVNNNNCYLNNLIKLNRINNIEENNKGYDDDGDNIYLFNQCYAPIMKRVLVI
jgi:hypothetical protein